MARFYNMAVVTFIILQMLDLFSTIVCLVAGGTEVNPIVRAILSLGGYPALALVKIIMTILIATYLRGVRRAIAIGVNLVLLAVVLNNFYVIWRYLS